MRKIVILIGIFYICFNLNGQTKAELEQKRIKTLAEISYVDNLLKTTSKVKSENLSEIKIIGNNHGKT